MEENELSKARERMNNFDPTLAINDPGTRWLALQNDYSEEEWQEYHKAKEQSLKRGEVWQDVRCKKHDEMANTHSKNNINLENM